MTAPAWQHNVTMLLDADAHTVPRPLVKTVNLLMGGEVLTEAALAQHLDAMPLKDPIVHRLHRALLSWDSQEDAPWAASNGESAPAPHTTGRRRAAYARLGFSNELAAALDVKCPVVENHEVVISKKFEPWYDDTSKRERHSFYWAHYEDYLREKGWGAEVIKALDSASDDVVRRLSDPTRAEAKRTRGLVIGYVQSGKTANFTGVIAKAVDSGYRLVIVLTGTVEMLRAQTQRRLDKELVGYENLVHGLDTSGETWLKEFDYAGDTEWEDGSSFVRHPGIETADGVPRIIRATTLGADYKRLKQELTKLRFPSRPKKSAPLNDPENLAAADAYLAVVKKNSPTLKKLITDLKAVGAKTLGELPILIIDDESDQASLDTTSPKIKAQATESERKRTAINKAISEILSLAPRAQYVGYTATPFANVFVDPTDEQDIFPSDFLVTLHRPSGYMGVADFHDIERDWTTEPRNLTTSNRLAHVRDLEQDVDAADLDGELLDALDCFVLSGAIKLYRAAQGAGSGKHHTMLVHESVRTSDHRKTAERVGDVWSANPATSPKGMARLETLWTSDYQPVIEARSDGPMPLSFDDLRPYVGHAYARITSDGDPVVVVNSDAELQKNAKRLNFDAEPVWRILVGGTKLSRGFTVEGLTVSYYRRSAGQGDTLMQAGRWFGYRKGYRDLVRLFIPDDLYQAFEAVLRDEEALRLELAQYEGFDAKGEPLLTPQAVPPLIRQHLPAVKLTARNKMWNARLIEQGVGGRIRDLYMVPGRDDGTHKQRNVEAIARLLSQTGSPVQINDGRNLFDARIGLVENTAILELLGRERGLRWNSAVSEQVRPQVRFFENVARDARVDRWAVIWPQLGEGGIARLEGVGNGLRLVERARRAGRHDFSGSDIKHRRPAQALALDGHAADPSFAALAEGSDVERLGAVLVYLAWDPRVDGTPKPTADEPADPKDIAVLVSMVVPEDAAPGGRALVWERVQDDDLHRDLAAIDAPAT